MKRLLHSFIILLFFPFPSNSFAQNIGLEADAAITPFIIEHSHNSFDFEFVATGIEQVDHVEELYIAFHFDVSPIENTITLNETSIDGYHYGKVLGTENSFFLHITDPSHLELVHSNKQITTKAGWTGLFDINLIEQQGNSYPQTMGPVGGGVNVLDDKEEEIKEAESVKETEQGNIELNKSSSRTEAMVTLAGMPEPGESIEICLDVSIIIEEAYIISSDQTQHQIYEFQEDFFNTASIGLYTDGCDGNSNRFANYSIPKHTIHLYPNPAKHEIQFSLAQEMESASIAIYNIQGKKVMESNEKGIQNHRVDIQHLPKGIYTIQVYNESENFVSKFIKE